MRCAVGRLLMLIALTAVCGGCTTVYVPRPVGDTPVSLDPHDWNGTWCDPTQFVPVPGTLTVSAVDSDCLTVTVVDPDAGVVDATDKDETYRVHLRYVGESRNVIYVSVESEEGYAFVGRMQKQGGLLVAWGVAGPRITQEVEAGRLPGRAPGDVYLESLGADALARIANEPAVYFDVDDITAAVRVSGP